MRMMHVLVGSFVCCGISGINFGSWVPNLGILLMLLKLGLSPSCRRLWLASVVLVSELIVRVDPI